MLDQHDLQSSRDPASTTAGRGGCLLTYLDTLALAGPESDGMMLPHRR